MKVISAFSPPVGSRMILACRDTLAAGLATRFAGLHPTEPSETRVDRRDLDSAIRIMEYESLPAIVAPIDGHCLPDIHDFALTSAWREGAWDLQMVLHPPLSGAQLGIVDIHRGYECASIELALIAAARAGRLATWLWRPMLGGPSIRQRAHLARDITLRANGGRDGSPPRGPDVIWDWRGSRAWEITLGVGTTTDRPPQPSRADRRATNAQRAYIVHLRQKTRTEIGDPLPASLTISEASRMIDRLLATP